MYIHINKTKKKISKFERKKLNWGYPFVKETPLKKVNAIEKHFRKHGSKSIFHGNDVPLLLALQLDRAHSSGIYTASSHYC